MHIVNRRYRISDADLSMLIRTGERDGAEMLYDTYGNFLFLAIIRIVPNEEIAEKVLQAAFQEIWASADCYDAEKERIYTWMISIARDIAYEALSAALWNDENKIKSL